MELPDRAACYRALQSRDPRFNGLLFVGVTSTSNYCRPVCPARTPKFENCRFFHSAAAAQEASFRPCVLKSRIPSRHALFDDDIVVPADALVRLLSHSMNLTVEWAKI
jgi:methylphosphotriester-DNA--protein-cysteine methyltransferase